MTPDEFHQMYMTHERTYKGTGRTTAAMLAAPVGAVYIWPNAGSIRYARRLADFLGREDLEVVSRGWLTKNWRGKRDLKVRIDHATELSSMDFDVLGAIKERYPE